jgi:hypothetical protein
MSVVYAADGRFRESTIQVTGIVNGIRRVETAWFFPVNINRPLILIPFIYTTLMFPVLSALAPQAFPACPPLPSN